MRKPALPGQTSDISNIRKTNKCCRHAKTSFTRANIRYVKHSKTKKCCKHPKSSFSRANIRYVNHPKKQKVLQTSEKQLFQENDVTNIRKIKKGCKHAKTSFTRANFRNVKHPKNRKVLQTSENQLYHGKHPICQTSEKPKSAAYMQKPALPGQTIDMSNIQKPKCAANIRKEAFPEQTSDMSNIRKKTKSAANIRKAAFQGQTSDVSNIRKTKKCCKHAKTSFTRANIRYVKHPKIQKVLQLSEDQLYHGKHLICQTSEKAKVL